MPSDNEKYLNVVGILRGLTMSEMSRPKDLFEQIRFFKYVKSGRPMPNTDCRLPLGTPETYRGVARDDGTCTWAPVLWDMPSLYRPLKKPSLWARLLKRTFCRDLPKTCLGTPKVQTMSLIGSCGTEWPGPVCKARHA